MARQTVPNIVKSILSLNIIDFADLATIIGPLFTENGLDSTDVDHLRELIPMKKVSNRPRIIRIIGCREIKHPENPNWSNSHGGRSFIQLIKLVRELTGLGLRETKDIVDALEFNGTEIKFTVPSLEAWVKTAEDIESFGYIVKR
jgi:hypothetical protein